MIPIDKNLEPVEASSTLPPSSIHAVEATLRLIYLLLALTLLPLSRKIDER